MTSSRCRPRRRRAFWSRYLPPRQDSEPGSTQLDPPSLVLNHLDTRVVRFAFSPADPVLCGFSGNEVRVWRLGSVDDDGTCQVFHESAPIEDCRVSPAGDTLLMLVNKTPQVARLGPGGEFQRSVIEELNDAIVDRLEISPDGRWGLLLSDSGPSYFAEMEQPTENVFAITSLSQAR